MPFRAGWSGGRWPGGPPTVERGPFSGVNYFDLATPAWTAWTFAGAGRIEDFATAQVFFTTSNQNLVTAGNPAVFVFVNVNGLNVGVTTTSGVEYITPFALSVDDNGKDISFAVTYDGAHSLKLYVNGAFVSELVTVGTIAALSLTTNIGRLASGASPWKGSIISLQGTNVACTYAQIATWARSVVSRTTRLVVPSLPGASATFVVSGGTLGAGVTEHGAVPSVAATINWLRYFRALCFGDSTDLGSVANLGGYLWVMRDAYVADKTHYAFLGPAGIRAEVSGYCIPGSTILDFANAGPDPVVPQITAFRPAIVIVGPAYNDLRAGPVAVPTVAARMTTLLTEIRTACPWVRIAMKFCLTSDPGDTQPWPSTDRPAYVAATAAWNDGPDGRAAVVRTFGSDFVTLAPAYPLPVEYSDDVHPTQNPRGYPQLGTSMLAAVEPLLPAQ